MAKKRQLSVLLTAKNAMKKGLRGAHRDLKRWATRASKLAKGIGILIGSSIAAGVGLAAKAFVELDTEMVKSLAIMTDVNEQMRKQMRMTARTLSKDVTFSAAELAKGYFFLASAGKSAAQSQILLGDVAEFAQAGQFDLATATTLLADAQKTLGLSSRNASKDQKSLVRVSDVLVKANTLANANVQQFSEALTNQAGPAMRAFKIDLEEGTAILAAYADQGIKGAEAGTMLGRALRLMIPAANQNAEAYKKLGIKVFNSEGNLRNMADITLDMEKAFASMSVSQRSAALETLGFQKRMQASIFPLIGASDRIRKYEKELRKAGGTTKKVAEEQLNSLTAQWKLFTNGLNDSIASLLGFNEGADSVVQTLKEINKFFREDAMEWINTIKIMAIESEFAVKKIWSVLTDLFSNIFVQFIWVGDNWGKLWANNLDILKAFAMDSGKIWLAAAKNWFLMITTPIRGTIMLWKNAFIGLWKFIKSGFKFSIKDSMKNLANALDETFKPFKDNFINAVSGIGKEMEKSLAKAGVSKLEFVGLDAIKANLAALDKELEARKNKFTKGAIGGIPGLPPKGDDDDNKIDLPKILSKSDRFETSVTAAVQRGSAEALRIENTRLQKTNKVVNNTGKTASTAKRILDYLVRKGDQNLMKGIELEDAFGGVVV